MSVAILDINDSNLQLWHTEQPLQSPGYALLEGTQYTFGNGARAAARLQPRKINTRFWWQLNTQALQPALGPARHTGDLVHAHLLDIHQRGGKPEEIVLSVSGSLEREQLALVLGIIEQCPFNAVGLINRSVALASQYGGPGKIYHLEIQLHQAVISELSKNDGQVELRRSLPLPGCGLLQLQERLVELIASAFIRQTRFDPRRKAETEQLLYDALPGALRELQGASETNLEVGGYRARIVRSELVAAGSRLFDSIPETTGVLAPTDQLIADPLASLLPGLRDRLPGIELLAGDALPQALRPHLPNLVQRDQTLNFITALPLLESAVIPSAVIPSIDDKPAGQSDAEPEQPMAAQVTTAATAPPAPTHLLLGAIAQPLAADGLSLADDLELYYHDGSWQLRGKLEDDVQVNGVTYALGSALESGDSITSASGITAVLITVQR